MSPKGSKLQEKLKTIDLKRLVELLYCKRVFLPFHLIPRSPNTKLSRAVKLDVEVLVWKHLSLLSEDLQNQEEIYREGAISGVVDALGLENRTVEERCILLKAIVNLSVGGSLDVPDFKTTAERISLKQVEH